MSPAVVLAGADSFLPTEYFRLQAQAIGGQLHIEPGGHFFPQQDAQKAAEIMRRHLDET
jgi:surfactin synthase thioesterase subunit